MSVASPGARPRGVATRTILAASFKFDFHLDFGHHKRLCGSAVTTTGQRGWKGRQVHVVGLRDLGIGAKD